jgi:biopolymer transport protein ExbD
MNLSRNLDEKVGYQVSPLIDIVFLLILYFMVTASLVKKEADIAFALPGPDTLPPVDIPVEVLVEIVADGTVQVEGIRYSRQDLELDGLKEHLSRLREVARTQSSDFFVSIMPHEETLHQRVIDVMDACTAAGVHKLGFAQSI